MFVNILVEILIIRLCGSGNFAAPWGLTNCASYGTLAKVTSLRGLYKHLTHLKDTSLRGVYKVLTDPILNINTLLILNNITLIEN